MTACLCEEPIAAEAVLPTQGLMTRKQAEKESADLFETTFAEPVPLNEQYWRQFDPVRVAADDKAFLEALVGLQARISALFNVPMPAEPSFRDQFLFAATGKVYFSMPTCTPHRIVFG
jgi:hypothetical protein